MNIKSKEFLERLELGEEKNNKIALTGLLLGAISILIALGKNFITIAIIYGILISGISLYSLITNIKEEKFYKKINFYKENKGKVITNIIADIMLIIFGVSLIIYVLITIL